MRLAYRANALRLRCISPAPVAIVVLWWKATSMEIHATVIDNILTQNFIAKPKWSKIYDLLAIIILARCSVLPYRE